jgi:molybdopterin-guanine dinucleotide biosynthesis protein
LKHKTKACFVGNESKVLPAIRQKTRKAAVVKKRKTAIMKVNSERTDEWKK